MMNNPQLPKLKSIFKGIYLDYNTVEICENDTDSKGRTFTMKRAIVGEPGKIDYAVFRIDPNKVTVFPYFAEVKDLNKICDFIIFAETNADILILLIEMKRHSGSPEKQLKLSEIFIDFVLERAKQIGVKLDKEIKVRKLGVKDSHISSKETTKYYKDFHFNQDYYSLEQGGRQIRLRQMIEAPVY